MLKLLYLIPIVSTFVKKYYQELDLLIYFLIPKTCILKI